MKLMKFILVVLGTLCSMNINAMGKISIDSLLSINLNELPDTTKITHLSLIANNYDNTNRDSSIIIFKQALEIAREIDDFPRKVNLLTSIGGNYCFGGQYLKSMEYLDLAENILLEYPNKRSSANLHYYKSLVFLSIDRVYQSSEHAMAALQLYKSLNMSYNMGAVYTLLSSIYEELYDDEKSLYYAKKAYQNAFLNNDSADLAGKLNNIATLYYNNGMVDSAYYFIRQAIVINKNHDVKIWLGINYQNLASYFLMDKELDSAEIYIQLAIDMCNKTGYMINSFPATEIKAKIALAKNDTIEAITIYHSIVESEKDFESLKVKVNAYKALAEIANHQADYVNSIKYLKYYKSFDDSLKRQYNSSMIKTLEMQMEYEEQQNRLELENEHVRNNSQKKNFFIIILTGLIFFLSMSIFFILRLHRAKAEKIKVEKQNLELELESQNREMTANVMSLLKKNEMLTGISKKLLETRKSAVKDETKQVLNTISKELQKIKDVELWEEFDIRFKQVNQEFYAVLLNIAPQLSPGELRMCAFLKMNMSSKDISAILNIEPHSIDNTRYNIRKKLKIDSKDNLIVFLSKL